MSGSRGRLFRSWSFVLPLLLAFSVPATSFADWELLGGWEADSHSNGYGFAGAGYLHPVTPRIALATRLSGGYLYYRFPANGGETKVTSPNGTLLAGARVSGERASLTVLAGAETSTVRRESTTPAGQTTTRETGVDAVLNGTLWARIADPWDFLALANYDAANRYTWARGTVKYRVTAATAATGVFLGPEFTGQGNSDITSFQGGAALQVARRAGRVSIDIRGGYKRSTFHEGPSQSGPYWGVGFYALF